MRHDATRWALCASVALLVAWPVAVRAQAKPRSAPTKAAAKAAPAPTGARGKQGSLGSKDPGLFNLTGSIFFLPANTRAMPKDLEHQKVEGTIYTDRLDVPVRRFTEGFPGVTDRFEWFGVLYSGRFFTPADGTYLWTLQSDDGSRLSIDRKQVIDNDGIHGFGPKDGKVELTKGPHDIGVWYYQGPATEIGLRLWVTPPNGARKVFDLSNFAGPMADAMKSLKAEATPDGIRIRLDAALLFDTAKWDLKPRAQQAIKNLGQVIAAYPAAKIRIVGYTDAVGGEEYNLGLSQSRATSVKEALAALDPPEGVAFETAGLGKANPVATNDTANGRTMNRRVEVFIKPLATTVFETTAMESVQNQREVKPQREAERQREAAVRPTAKDEPAEPHRPQVPAAAAAGKTYEAAPAPRASDSPTRGAERAGGPEPVAAVARIKDVIARYAAALGARDQAALARVREPIASEEQALLAADQATVTLIVTKVDVEGTHAAATCQRTIDSSTGGKPTKVSGTVTVQLARKPTGWVITDVR